MRYKITINDDGFTAKLKIWCADDLNRPIFKTDWRCPITFIRRIRERLLDPEPIEVINHNFFFMLWMQVAHEDGPPASHRAYTECFERAKEICPLEFEVDE